jgi:hypothetical protein
MFLRSIIIYLLNKNKNFYKGVNKKQKEEKIIKKN